MVAESRRNSTYIAGLVDALRSTVKIPEPYEELSSKLLSSFPKGFQRVVTVANTYRRQAGERERCGRGDEIIIKSTNSKISKDFQAFCEMVKIRTDLLFETLLSSVDRLQTSVIYFSKKDSFVRVNASQVTAVDELSSNQEEADNKVILHSAHVITKTEGSVILWSLSGDTDIMIIAISLIDASKRVLVEYGNGKNSLGVWFNSIDLDDNIRAALIGFHTLTGNNYVLSIFMRGKQVCFKVMKQRDEAINAFRLLGRLGVERRAHSCIGKFCMSFIQIQRYRYQQSLKEII